MARKQRTKRAPAKRPGADLPPEFNAFTKRVLTYKPPRQPKP